ncbi:sodium-dependent multivitamin transporter, putative, partial [Ixodes scapularis]
FAVFGVLMVVVLGLGLFFSFRRRSSLSVEEVFLGSRTLQMIPLALSVLATLVSSTGIISFTAHFYAYGMNMLWCILPYLMMIPVIVHIIIPVLYRLKVTSVFEYLGARYGSKISLTACIIYFLLT